MLAAGRFADEGTATQFAALVSGGAVAAETHPLKATTRVVIKLSPEPFSDWIASLEVHLSEDREVIAVRVSPGVSLPYQYRGASYLRVGNTTQTMSSEEYNRILFERMHNERRWENQPANG